MFPFMLACFNNLAIMQFVSLDQPIFSDSVGLDHVAYVDYIDYVVDSVGCYLLVRRSSL